MCLNIKKRWRISVRSILRTLNVNGELFLWSGVYRTNVRRCSFLSTNETESLESRHKYRIRYSFIKIITIGRNTVKSEQISKIPKYHSSPATLPRSRLKLTRTEWKRFTFFVVISHFVSFCLRPINSSFRFAIDRRVVLVLFCLCVCVSSSAGGSWQRAPTSG